MRFKVFGPHGGLIGRGTAPAVAKALPRMLARFRKVRIEPSAPTPPPVLPVTMYDSVNVSQIPAHAWAVAGYVNGAYQTFPELVKRFPAAHKLSITVTANGDAECLDVENGDASPDQAPAWMKRQWGRGVKRPVVYMSLSQVQTVVETLTKAGIGRDGYRLWTAHYTGRPHRCTTSCGFGFSGFADATQYTDQALGRNLDASLCAPHFFT